MFGRAKPKVLGEHALGPLEFELLRRLWTLGDATVRELLDCGGLEVAYTTVMTTLDRLFKKGILEREPDGQAFRYRAKVTEEELNRQVIAGALKTLISRSTDVTVPVSFLVDTISDHNRIAFDELARAVERKRRQLKRRTS